MKPEGKFILAWGPHAGSKWLATTLNSERHCVDFRHELKLEMGGLFRDLVEAEFKSGLTLPAYEPYWEYVRTQLTRCSIFGDAGSWIPLTIPKVHEIIPVARIIYLVRNGVQQVHSMLTKSILGRVGKRDWLYTHFLRRLWVFAGKPGRPWQKKTWYEQLCWFWQECDKAPKWLRDQGFEVEVYRLEDLTQDEDALRSLILSVAPERKLSDEEIHCMQRRDVNRKVRGDRTSSKLWSQWSPELRTAFEQVCGPGMKRYGYAIPDEP